MLVQLIGFSLGVAAFFAIVTGVQTLVWRLRGRPICGFKWRMHWRNLVDDGWRSYRMDNGRKGYYWERPKWRGDDWTERHQ